MEASQHALEPPQGGAAAVAAEAIEAEAAASDGDHHELSSAEGTPHVRSSAGTSTARGTTHERSSAGTSILPDDLSPDETSEDELQRGGPADPLPEEAHGSTPPGSSNPPNSSVGELSLLDADMSCDSDEGAAAPGAAPTAQDPAFGDASSATRQRLSQPPPPPPRPSPPPPPPQPTQALLLNPGSHAFLKNAGRQAYLIIDAQKGTVKTDVTKSHVWVVKLADVVPPGAPDAKLPWKTLVEQGLERGKWVLPKDFEEDAPTTVGIPGNVGFPVHTKKGDRGASKPDAAKIFAEMTSEVPRRAITCDRAIALTVIAPPSRGMTVIPPPSRGMH